MCVKEEKGYFAENIDMDFPWHTIDELSQIPVSGNSVWPEFALVLWLVDDDVEVVGYDPDMARILGSPLSVRQACEGLSAIMVDQVRYWAYLDDLKQFIRPNHDSKRTL